jgi:hypothetical protein
MLYQQYYLRGYSNKIFMYWLLEYKWKENIAMSALQLSQFLLSRNSLVPALRVPTPVIPFFIMFNSCAIAGGPCRELFFIKIIWNILWKTGITGVGTREAGTHEFSNLKTEITGGFHLQWYLEHKYLLSLLFARNPYIRH